MHHYLLPAILPLPVLIFFFSSFSLSYAWQTFVHLHYSMLNGYVTNFVGVCENVAPGECCRGPPYGGIARIEEFFNLPQGGIAAFWESSNFVSGCNERILETHTGAPYWRYQDPKLGGKIAGGNCIRCPLGTGIKGWIEALDGFCLGPRNRAVGSGSRETESVQPTWGYPNVVSVNGTNYTSQHRHSLVYRDSAGTLLDLTNIR